MTHHKTLSSSYIRQTGLIRTLSTPTRQAIFALINSRETSRGQGRDHDTLEIDVRHRTDGSITLASLSVTPESHGVPGDRGRRVSMPGLADAH